MVTQILFLGTAGDALTLGMRGKTAGGIIIQTETVQLHLNPGPGALVTATNYGIDVKKTNIILVTDNTILHSHDTAALIEVMTLSGLDTCGLLVAAKSALMTENREELACISSAVQSAVEKTIVLTENAKIEYNTLQIHGIKIKNKDPNAMGAKIITPSFSLGYTGITKYFQKVAEAFKDVEILILEVPKMLEEKREEGLCVADAEKLIAEIKPQLAVLTGFGKAIHREDTLEMTRALYRKTGVQCIAAKEGFSFDPTNYAVKLRQKRLQTF